MHFLNNPQQIIASDHQANLSTPWQFIALIKNFFHITFPLKNSHIFSNNSTGFPNVNSSLFFIPSQHPNFNASFPKSHDCYFDVVLQFILNGCCPNQDQLSFYNFLQLLCGAMSNCFLGLHIANVLL